MKIWVNKVCVGCVCVSWGHLGVFVIVIIKAIQAHPASNDGQTLQHGMEKSQSIVVIQGNSSVAK
jgi:hypothetical protein